MPERRIGVRGIAYQNGQLLSVLHKDKSGNPVDFWATPGGGLDPGENLSDGLYREMIEETGIAPQIGALLFVQQFIFEKENGEAQEQLEFFFHIKNPEEYYEVTLAKTTHGDTELAACEFLDPKVTNILPTFLQSVDIDEYLWNDKPVLIWDELRT